MGGQAARELNYWLCNKYLVGDVLLFDRCVSFGVNQGWMCHQITPVLHYEAPVPKQEPSLSHINYFFLRFQRTLILLALNQTAFISGSQKTVIDKMRDGWQW